MKNRKIDIVDVMVAVKNGELKAFVRNGFIILEDLKSGEAVRIGELND